MTRLGKKIHVLVFISFEIYPFLRYKTYSNSVIQYNSHSLQFEITTKCDKPTLGTSFKLVTKVVKVSHSTQINMSFKTDN